MLDSLEFCQELNGYEILVESFRFINFNNSFLMYQRTIFCCPFLWQKSKACAFAQRRWNYCMTLHILMWGLFDHTVRVLVLKHKLFQVSVYAGGGRESIFVTLSIKLYVEHPF